MVLHLNVVLHNNMLLMNNSFVMFIVAGSSTTKAEDCEADATAAAGEDDEGDHERAWLRWLHHGVLFHIKWMRHAFVKFIFHLAGCTIRTESFLVLIFA